MLALHGCTQAFSGRGECGLLSSCAAWASRGGGFSCCGLWALGLTGLGVVMHRLSWPLLVGSSWTRDGTCVPCIGGWTVDYRTTREALSCQFLNKNAMTSCSHSAVSLSECVNSATIILSLRSLKLIAPVLTFHLNSSPVFLGTWRMAPSWTSYNPYFYCLSKSVSLSPSFSVSLPLGSAGASLVRLLSFPHTPPWIHQHIFHQTISTDRILLCLNSSPTGTLI